MRGAISWLRTPLGLGLLGLGLGLVAACPQASGPTTTPDHSEGVEDDVRAPLIPSEPANKEAGDDLEVTIPLVGAEPVELASLKGQPVLLEISASWEPGFAEAHALYMELLAEHPDLMVIVVVADPADQALLELPPALAPAWDPAGALAAKLSVATFPTMFVIDRSGQISLVVNGWGDEVRAQLVSAVAEAVASSP